MTDWNTMETAPMDLEVPLVERRVLGFRDHPGKERSLFLMAYGENGKWVEWYTGQEVSPTHWMHIQYPSSANTN